MPWYGREFYGDENVLVMTLEQEAAYLRLLWNCWQEGSIPAEIAKLAAICKGTPAKRFEQTIWPALSGLFGPAAGRLVHHKVELLRAAKEQLRAKWSEGARLANEKRWGGDRSVIAERSGGNQRQIPAECRIPNTDYQTPSTCASDDAPVSDSLTPAEGAVSPRRNRRRKPKTCVMSTEQREWFGQFLNLHPKRGIQTASAESLWSEKVTERACFDFLMGRLREECAGDTTYLLGPWKWLRDHLALYANGVVAGESGGAARRLYFK